METLKSRSAEVFSIVVLNLKDTKETQMVNRISKYPVEFWRVVGLAIPKTPSKEDLSEAYKTIADFPTTYSIIEEFYEAMQTVRSDPDLSKEQQDLIYGRYGQLVDTLFSTARSLCEKMSEDVENAEK